MRTRGDFAARARRYAQLDADRRIGRRTFFFAAASVVSAAFASPLSVFALSPFMCDLSATLERFNLNQARQIAEGALYASGSSVLNTAHFVRAEQTLVQQMLERLRTCSRHTYSIEIAAADRALQAIALWCCRLGSEPHRRLHDAVVTSHRLLGRPPRFDRQGDRETLGNLLALGAAGGRRFP